MEAENPDCVVQVWGEDEARFGLQPILRRVWTKRGRRTTVIVEPRYQWMWLYAAVHPASGRVFWLILPHLDGECVQIFLDEFARAYVRQGKIIVLVCNGAPAHRSQKLRIPAGIEVVEFPAYTPELNPSERLWTGIKEGIVNERQIDIAEMEDKVIVRCRSLGEQAEAIKSMTKYHWWSYN